MSTPFQPKQALKFDGTLLKELQGEVTEVIAREVTKLVTIAPGALIHDNGCGYGAVTSEIIAISPPSDIQIVATDKNQSYLTALDKVISENAAWPSVKTEVMNANNLSFPDDRFDLSVTNFVLLGLTEEVAAARHILRTVKPGGTAVISVWKEKGQIALHNTHYEIRGADTPLPPFLALKDYTPEEFSAILAKAGWTNVEYVDKDVWVQMKDVKRWATIAWTFLGTPVGGWTQNDEDRWDETIDLLVKEITTSAPYVEEDGIHKIKMTATIAITKK